MVGAGVGAGCGGAFGIVGWLRGKKYITGPKVSADTPSFTDKE
jgi:hypothetical protein